MRRVGCAAEYVAAGEVWVISYLCGMLLVPSGHVWWGWYKSAQYDEWKRKY